MASAARLRVRRRIRLDAAALNDRGQVGGFYQNPNATPNPEVRRMSASLRGW
jgi:hypothetical protein